MELRQLEYFIAVADELSFTRAAHRVHVVQSALSTSVKKLEDELEVDLFDRSRQRIRLTPAGERFRDHARQVMHSARLATDALGEYRGFLSGTVDFGSLVTFGALDVTGVLGRFHRDHPHVRLRVRLSQAGSSAYLTEIAGGTLDLALISAPDRFPSGVDMRELAAEPMVFACRGDHRLAAHRRVQIGELAAEDLIGFPVGFGIRKLIDEAFASEGVLARTPYEMPSDYTVAAALISNGLGTAVMPASEAARFPELTAVQLATPIIWRIYLAQPATPNPAAATLAGMLLAAGAATE
ncbi:LysR family transcriptional regulator [Mycolicibacterium sp. XJ870]